MEENRKRYERMSTAELEKLLREDFQAQDSGELAPDELFLAAEVLAERERASGGADRAWDSFLRNYLPFHRDGSSLYEDPESPGDSDAADKPRHAALSALRQRLQRVAAGILLAALLGGGLTLASSQEVRAAFAGWIRELYEESNNYRYDGQGENASEERPRFCAPAWLPEGYFLEDVMDVGGIFLAYGGDGGSITFYCIPADGSVLTIYDTTPQAVSVAGKPADLYFAEENTALVWEDEEIGGLLWLTGQLSEEEILRIAESVQITEPLPPPNRPVWVPDGYTEYISSSGAGDITMAWRDSGEQMIHFRCIRGESREETLAEIEEAVAGLTQEEVLVGEYSAWLCCGRDGSSHLIWSDERDVLYWIYGPVTGEELMQMAESIP